MIYSDKGNIMVRDIRYTYLYDTRTYMGNGYCNFENANSGLFSKTMVG